MLRRLYIPVHVHTHYPPQMRRQSLPVNRTSLLSPSVGRSSSCTPTPHDPHSNISSPTSSSARSHASRKGGSVSPVPQRSRSRQRLLSEIGEEQPGSSSGDSDQIKQNQSDQSLSSPKVKEAGHHRQRSHSPRMSGRDAGGRGGERGGRGEGGQKKASKRSLRKKAPASEERHTEGSKVATEGAERSRKEKSQADIFERGYDDATVNANPMSSLPPKVRRSPLLLRRTSRDDMNVSKKEMGELHFGSSRSQRDRSLDRLRSPRISLKKKSNVPVEVTPPTPIGEAPPTLDGESNNTVDSDPVSTSTLSSFDDGISILNADSPPQLLLKGLEDPE